MRQLDISQMVKQILKDRSMWLCALVFFVLLGLDQVFKYFAPSVFKNYFFAFSIQLSKWLIYTVYVIVAFVIINYLEKNFFGLKKIEKFAWMLIVSGAILNLAERIVLGYVRDFIYITFSRWVGIYNLADGYIILGIIILIGSSFFNNKPSIKK